MTPVLRQILAVSKINLLSLPQRLWTSLSAMISVALVVFVLLGALALNNGFQNTLNSSGAETVAIVLRDGAGTEINSALTQDQQNLLEEAPGIARRDGQPLVSREMLVVVDGRKKSTGTRVNLPLRGLDPAGLKVREGFRITEGRMFAPGSGEIVVGRAALGTFDGLALGREARMGANSWKIVGIFESGGSVFESELWADRRVVQSLFSRGSTVQSLRVRLTGPGALASLQRYNAADPRLKTDIRTERSYFAAQSRRTSDLITHIGKPITLLMALGALGGAINAMYASVANRAGEIATLRTLGFGRLATFIGTMVEALLLAMSGGVIGMAAAFLIFNGLSVSTIGANFAQTVFELQLSTGQVLEGTFWAATLGLLGGFLPAWRAARRPITQLLD
ncbi:ABC transporter permease [Sphingomonas sp.]|uniref:ABC transporter permease n=1 Tax=Sphingomonas sp. TaxID=28214 RepID=UPI003D6D7893